VTGLGRDRKSKKFSKPPGAVPPPLPMSPRQAQRVSELWLVLQFGLMLWSHWRSRIDHVGTLELVAAMSRPVVSRRYADEVLEEARADAKANEPLPTAAMLFAATRWFVALDLSQLDRSEHHRL
jgi:hypothetical protein